MRFIGLLFLSLVTISSFSYAIDTKKKSTDSGKITSKKVLNSNAYKFCVEKGWKTRKIVLVDQPKELYVCILPNKQGVELARFYNYRNSIYKGLIDQFTNTPLIKEKEQNDLSPTEFE